MAGMSLPAAQPSRRSDVEPFHVMEVLAAAAERQRTHGDVISLCAGQPSTGAPRAAASPANPTGTIIDADELAAIARWCDAHGVLLVSDEIYHGISFGRATSSAWQTSRQGAVIGSVSKFFSMTGWRVGWMLVPAHLRRRVAILASNLTICPPAVSQHAALAALGEAARGELEEHVETYRRNRELVQRRLPEIGVTTYAPPDGAFYAWCDVAHLTDDSARWCADVLAATGVAITPGVDFDPADGHRFMRMSLAVASDELDEAFDRMVRFVVSSS